ncbi:MAG: 3-phosphoshikimate 1-carboxyvinyltransferase [Anaerovoracaceae bacterium]
MPTKKNYYRTTKGIVMINIRIIPSKSQAHRALICSALSKTECNVICQETSLDIEATRDCLINIKEALKNNSGECQLPCNESGSTLRFLLPIVLALGLKGSFLPEGRLPERPLSPLYEQLEGHGAKMSKQGTVPFVVEGQLQSGDYYLPGNVSSQFVSGLLFALPLIKGQSRIIITSQLESQAYVDMTLNTIENFGVTIKKEDNTFIIDGGQNYQGPREVNVEGDWSNGGFWLVAGALLSEGVSCSNLNINSLQGDKGVVEILRRFGADVEVAGDTVNVRKNQLNAIEIDAKDIPDLVPILSVVAAVSKGTTVIKNAERLRIKESDRLKAVRETLSILGADITETDDGLIITGREHLGGGVVDSFSDHRIAMMSAIASLVCTHKVVIKNSKAVNKSYPSFFTELQKFGENAKIERE